MKLFTKSNEVHNKYRSFFGSIIVLEGVIGVGKSTLGIALEKYFTQLGLSAKFYPEHVYHPLLEQYISDMKKYYYPFQLHMLENRMRIYKEAYQFSLTGGIAIVDRSIIGDLTFAQMQLKAGFIDQTEFEMIKRVMRDTKCPEPTVVLYLHCTPEVAFERMLKRGIESEKNGYTMEYFTKLNYNYENVIHECDHNILKIDWNTDKESQENASEIVEKLRTIYTQ